MSNLKINASMNTEEIIELIFEYLNNDENFISFSSYKYFKNKIQKEKTKSCTGWEDFFVKTFKEYILKKQNNKTDTMIFASNQQLIDEIDLETINDYKDIINNPNYNNMMVKNISFEEIKGSKDSRIINVKNPDIIEVTDSALFISPEMKNVIPMVKLIIKKHEENDMPYNIKINICGNDNDRITLLGSEENLEKHYELLQEVKKENPEIFTNMGCNKLWGRIDNEDCIYAGILPKIKGYSKIDYCSLRGTIIDEALKDLKEEYNLDKTTTVITPEMIDYFKNSFKKYALCNNIYPENYALNKSDDNQIVLSDEHKKDLNIQTKYAHVKNDVIAISTTRYSMDEKQLMIISLDDYEKLYEDNEQSKEIKKDIYKKLEKLHKQNKFKRKIEKINILKLKDNSMSLKKFNYNDMIVLESESVSYDLYKKFPSFVISLICATSALERSRERGIIKPNNVIETSKANYNLCNINPRNEKKLREKIIDKYVMKDEEKILKKDM